jgi:hypothetical protein
LLTTPRAARGIGEAIREEARARIDRELEQATVQSAAKLALRTQAAMRQVALAEKGSESGDTRRQNLRNAIEAIREARGCATHLGDKATEGWTYMFEAFCLRGLSRYQEAIAQQLTGMNLLERSDALDYYNLACFYALVENDTGTRQNLVRAIELGGELWRRHARVDADLAAMREAGRLADLLGCGTNEGDAPYIGALDGPPSPNGGSGLVAAGQNCVSH